MTIPRYRRALRTLRRVHLAALILGGFGVAAAWAGSIRCAAALGLLILISLVVSLEVIRAALDQETSL
jgi:hypothetical protein